ncbi:beta-2-microglobulin [Rhinolophus ferrumequinum]|uniref:Beta-2-microglobulin n=1 Tax=Rhinolophus ferrumequinum TaxID=59479 RepID=A0A7J7XN99_RHIFE|nr:beta-2-microglobulin [Rhinolophus ferrumequinum]
MSVPVTLVLLGLLCLSGLDAEPRSPRVQVYSRHPAQIEIDLLKNGEKMKVEQSDLSFSKDWSFYLLVHANFTPSAEDEYTCRVKHITLSQPKRVKWDQYN